MAKNSPRARRLPKSRSAEGAICYLESSAVLSALLEHDASALRALRTSGHRVASSLTFAECARALVRARVALRLSPDQTAAAHRALTTLERRCTIIEVSPAVLGRVGRPFPVEPIRTLDAVHLATAELLGKAPHLMTVITRDSRIRDNALALGYRVG